MRLLNPPKRPLSPRSVPLNPCIQIEIPKFGISIPRTKATFLPKYERTSDGFPYVLERTSDGFSKSLPQASLSIQVPSLGEPISA
jgi:hypothetical protein